MAPITGPAFIRQLSRTAPGTVIACDVGQHQMWVAQHYEFDHPRRHLTSGGLGTMGFGLPAAIGAQFADRNSTVINVTGDGSFMMNAQELATIRRYKLLSDHPRQPVSGHGAPAARAVLQQPGKPHKPGRQPGFRGHGPRFDIPALHIDRTDQGIETIWPTTARCCCTWPSAGKKTYGPS